MMLFLLPQRRICGIEERMIVDNAIKIVYHSSVSAMLAEKHTTCRPATDGAGYRKIKID